MSPEELMQQAIESARIGMSAGQSPFGCAIAREGTLLAAAHNTVVQTVDITAHAEVNALRAACSATRNIHLEGAVVATTCEPCPMCMAALHWARVDTVYFGAFFYHGSHGALAAVRWEKWKLFLNPSLQLYDLENDPGERKPIRNGQIARKLRGMAILFQEEMRAAARPAGDFEGTADGRVGPSAVRE